MTNEIKIEGWVTGEVKNFTTSSNMNIKNFSINSTVGKKNGKGGYDYLNNYFNIKAFNCATNIKEKDRVIITGNLRQEIWEKNGKKNYSVVIYANDIQLVKAAEDKAEPKEEQKEEDNLIEIVEEEEPIDINDIPF